MGCMEHTSRATVAPSSSKTQREGRERASVLGNLARKRRGGTDSQFGWEQVGQQLGRYRGGRKRYLKHLRAGREMDDQTLWLQGHQFD